VHHRRKADDLGRIVKGILIHENDEAALPASSQFGLTTLWPIMLISAGHMNWIRAQ
jgi:hypothetical protein